jgi:hypothetical protein
MPVNKKKARAAAKKQAKSATQEVPKDVRNLGPDAVRRAQELIAAPRATIWIKKDRRAELCGGQSKTYEPPVANEFSLFMDQPLPQDSELENRTCLLVSPRVEAKFNTLTTREFADWVTSPDCLHVEGFYSPDTREELLEARQALLDVGYFVMYTHGGCGHTIAHSDRVAAKAQELNKEDFMAWVLTPDCLENERFYVVDGAHRLTVAQELKIEYGYFMIFSHTTPNDLRNILATSANVMASASNANTFFDVLTGVSIMKDQGMDDLGISKTMKRANGDPIGTRGRVSQLSGILKLFNKAVWQAMQKDYARNKDAGFENLQPALTEKVLFPELWIPRMIPQDRLGPVIELLVRATKNDPDFYGVPAEGWADGGVARMWLLVYTTAMMVQFPTKMKDLEVQVSDRDSGLHEKMQQLCGLTQTVPETKKQKTRWILTPPIKKPEKNELKGMDKHSTGEVINTALDGIWETVKATIKGTYFPGLSPEPVLEGTGGDTEGEGGGNAEGEQIVTLARMEPSTPKSFPVEKTMHRWAKVIKGDITKDETWNKLLKQIANHQALQPIVMFSPPWGSLMNTGIQGTQDKALTGFNCGRIANALREALPESGIVIIHVSANPNDEARGTWHEAMMKNGWEMYKCAVTVPTNAKPLTFFNFFQPVNNLHTFLPYRKNDSHPRVSSDFVKACTTCVDAEGEPLDVKTIKVLWCVSGLI